MKTNINIKLENSYLTLPNIMYKKQMPTIVESPKIILFNDELAKELNLNNALNSDYGASILSGNIILKDSIPIAQAYAGHQFGYFSILGDGRAILLGEYITPDLKRIDIQLKGSGLTPYSRRGDGKATLSSMLREYIISEAMNALNIKTTRSLAVIGTGEKVIREKLKDGAILTRISDGHIRVGTFQFASKQNIETVKKLADYSIKRFFPNISSENSYLEFLDAVIDRQANLIAKWQQVGFIHGVMNTDNTSIAGESIDYGPCAFMDTYNTNTVFSSIDYYGRYAYNNQHIIAQWNLARFSETLLPLLHEDENEAIKIAENSIKKFMTLYENYWLEGMRKKLGLFSKETDDKKLIDNLFKNMDIYNLDFTNTFINLMQNNYESPIEDINNWIIKWKERLNRQFESFLDSFNLMKSVNPYIIPRNHQVETALSDATNGDMTSIINLINALKSPFDSNLANKKYTLPPILPNNNYKTYCGT
jgi:uncharacterized protein YdiU (UPF0061 family)